ncbi:ParB/RepB/Spo0J family partition protein [Rhodococcoides fascians]|uniref:ParB/RepB/Spo0J family partition protein n=1 Tax=Rhodococcoides fascians TaxID=1828 RepID=UPI00068F347F|nr:ParB N-terminal domain-containing protein [Rhodococcus fascians]
MPATIHDLEVTDVKIAALRPYEDNPRKGDIAAIAESLKTNGQFVPIVVNKGTQTGRYNEILRGNHTALAAKKLKWPTIKAVHVDVDDEAATRIMLADNKTGQLGDFDEGLLANLLVDLPDLDGTGYTAADLDGLLADARDAAEDAVAAATPVVPPTVDPKPAPQPRDDGDDASDDGRVNVAGQPRSHSVILSYPLEQYSWVTARLAALGDLWDTASNADTLIRLIETQEEAAS